MTRKDYVNFAIAIQYQRNRHQECNCTGITDLVDNIEDIFAADNPRFDRKRFELACIPESPARKEEAGK